MFIDSNDIPNRNDFATKRKGKPAKRGTARLLRIHRGVEPPSLASIAKSYPFGIARNTPMAKKSQNQMVTLLSAITLPLVPIALFHFPLIWVYSLFYKYFTIKSETFHH